MKKIICRVLSGLSGYLSLLALRCGGYDGDYSASAEVLRYPECTVSSSKVQTLKEIENKLDKCVEGGKLYLDPYFSLSQLSAMVGSNRTYVSAILATKKGFKNYMNEFRFRHIATEIENLVSGSGSGSDTLEDSGRVVCAEDLAQIVLTSGFTDMRTFRRAMGMSDGIWAAKLRALIY